MCHTLDSSVFSSLLPAIMTRYRPDCLVLQCGADCLVGDPLGGFNLTPAALSHCVKQLMAYQTPMLVLGGGGYNTENTARCWTAITATILGMEELEDDIPDDDHYFTNYGPDFTATLPANMKLKCGIKFKLKNFFSSNQFDPNFSKSVEGGGKRQSDKNPVLTSFSCLDTPVLDRKER